MVEVVALSDWLTPTSLFLLLNAVIATILFTSAFSSHQHAGDPSPAPPQPQLQRPPSFFSRVASFNFYRPDYPDSSGNTDPNPPAPVTCYPSLLSRVPSFNFPGLHRATQPDPNESPEPEDKTTTYPVQFHQGGPEPEGKMENSEGYSAKRDVARAPSLLSRVASFNFPGLYRAAQPDPSESPEPEGNMGNSNSEGLAKRDVAPAPSLLSRVASFNLPGLHRAGQSDPSSAQQEPAQSNKGNEKPQESRAGKKKKKEARAGGGGETASFRRDIEEVDAKADDFINRFKQQLKLQRLDSLLRYRNSAT